MSRAGLLLPGGLVKAECHWVELFILSGVGHSWESAALFRLTRTFIATFLEEVN